MKFCLGGNSIDSGLAFSDSKMAALKSICRNNSSSKGNIMIKSCVHNALFGGEEFNYDNIGPFGIIMMAATYIMKMQVSS